MLRRLACLALPLLVAACSKPSPSAEETDVEAPPEPSPVESVTTPPEPPPPPPPPPPTPKKYARVLHTGDSMVGGGLARALRPKFEADGAKYYREVIESGTLHQFSQSDYLPTLLAKIKPDLVVLTLGANHVQYGLDLDRGLGPYVRKLVARVAHVDCYWIAPPIWKPSQARFNEWLRDQVAPCRFYDGSALDIARRADNIHPSEKGGEVWAEDFWSFYKGEGAFFEDTP